MAIDSLGSATNSNFQSGPSINATGRADINTSSSLSDSASQSNDTSLDIFRHELLLTKIKSTHTAYVNVISRDSIPMSAPLLIRTEAESPRIPSFLSCTLENTSHLDMTISTFYADLGDARNELEYFMAFHQISIHGNLGVTREFETIQPHLEHGTGVKTHRRNAFFFMTIDTPDDLIQSSIGTKYAQKSSNSGQDTCSPTNLNGAKVFIVKADSESAFAKDCTTKNSFKAALMTLFVEALGCVDKYKPQVVVSQRSHDAPITAPEFRYAGVALTDACMHQARGDTAVTVNHYSALTTQNGPYDVYIGDDVGWMFNVEQKNLCPDGNRKGRIVMTYSTLMGLLIGTNDTRKAANLKLTHQSVMIAKFNTNSPDAHTKKARIGSLKDSEHEARGKYPRFMLVPLKHGSHISKRSSVMDRKRRIGKAISSCKSYGRVDWINGASSEM